MKQLTVRPLQTASAGLGAAFRASRAFAYSPTMLVLLWMMIDPFGKVGTREGQALVTDSNAGGNLSSSRSP